ncbi:hypothetical protein LTS10_013123 [Elasticomyces elasticus]|nr:hypothetical protein LTS10_013123 [Elasticomyces elasticus]
MHSERTFQFVSDPNHKDNLSGRVTAACLNCRRKKIKCSGEAECRQCREKGLVCKGPPPRKRPNRDLIRTHGAEASASNRSSPAEGANRDAFHRLATPNRSSPGYAFHGPDSNSSHDSPITSAFAGSEGTDHQPGREIHPLPSLRRPRPHIAPTLKRLDGDGRPLTVIPPETSPFAFTEAFHRHQLGVNDSSPVTAGPSEWSSIPRAAAGGQPLSSMTASQMLGRFTAHGSRIPGSTPTTASGSISTFSGGSIAESVRNYSRQQSPDLLIQAAEALEDEASSLRQIAHHRQSLRTNMQGFEDYGAYGAPSQPMLNFTQPSNHNQVAFGAPPSLSSETPYQFDPLTMFRWDGSLKSGYTPPGVEYGMEDAGLQDPQNQGQHLFDFDMQQIPTQAATAYGVSNQDFASSANFEDGVARGRMQRVFHERLLADADAAWTGLGGDQNLPDTTVK